MRRCAECGLNNQQNRDHPICIPLPSDDIRGCIISRDPTSAFINPRKKPIITRGNFNFSKGKVPPKWLYERIQSFRGFPPDSVEAKKLSTFFDLNCYWTHFHKCPTDKQGKGYPRFSYPNGKICADRWFEFECTENKLNDKILILLGRDVERYFQERPDHPLLKSEHVFFLPHPSTANCGNGWSWNKCKLPNDPDIIKLNERLTKLMACIMK